MLYCLQDWNAATWSLCPMALELLPLRTHPLGGTARWLPRRNSSRVPLSTSWRTPPGTGPGDWVWSDGCKEKKSGKEKRILPQKSKRMLF